MVCSCVAVSMRLPAVMLAVLAAVAVAGVDAAPAPGLLSPAAWPPGELSTWQRLNTQQCYPNCSKPLAVSSLGVVAGTTNALAVHAGVVALRHGGNCVDAVVVAAAAECVLAMNSYVSLAGVASVLVYNASTNTTTYFDGGWNAIAANSDLGAATDGYSDTVGAGVMVGGFMSALDRLAADRAVFPLATLLEPATYFAEDGFIVPPVMGALIYIYNDTLLATPEGRRLFTNPATGQLYRAGERMLQPDTAATLRNVSAKGTHPYMYDGAWAQEAVVRLRALGSNVTLDSFANYTTEAMAPEVAHVGALPDHMASAAGDAGPQLITSAAQYGGISAVVQANLLRVSGVSRDSTVPAYQNATSFFWLIQFVRWTTHVSPLTTVSPEATAVIEAHFNLSFSQDARMTVQHAQKVWDLMRAPGGVARIKAFWATFYQTTAPTPTPYLHSDGIVAADSHGNLCSMVHTTNTEVWQSGVFVGGVYLPNAGKTFQAFAEVANGGRVGTPKHPELLRGGGFDGAVSVVGAALSEYSLQTIDAVMHGLTPKQAVDAPHFYGMAAPAGGGFPAAQVVRRGDFSSTFLDEVRAMGQPLQEVSVQQALDVMGVPVALVRNSTSGVMQAGATPDGDGAADGV